MTKLEMRFLGGLELSRDDAILVDFSSEKGKALLCYLAVTGQSHSRAALAGLLWPESAEENARASLRRTLTQIRKMAHDCLNTTRQTVTMNVDAPIWVDVIHFETLVQSATDIDRLQETVALYQGDFLAHFFLPDAPAFDRWVLGQRTRLRQMALETLHTLVADLEERREFETAMPYARHSLEIEPWREDGHRDLMRLLALSGQRNQAIAHYLDCRQLLHTELGVAPAPQTELLYQAIRDGEPLPGAGVGRPRPTQAEAAPSPRLETADQARLEQLIAEAEPPPFIAMTAPVAQPPAIVGRERELARMAEALAEAVAGRGGLFFVSGEAGAGKTALVSEFTRRALADHSRLLYAAGACDVYTGVGAPFAPFQGLLQTLTGNVERQWRAGILSPDSARRLWRLLPLALQVLLDHGRALVGTLVPLAELVQRTAAYVAHYPEQRPILATLLAHEASLTNAGSARQERFFFAYTAVLIALASRRPLLLILDDLHWADLSSIALLGHVGQRLADQPILLVATYRPEELTLGRGGGPHTLRDLLSEFKRLYGDRQIDLDLTPQEDGRAFVDALLDAEPNRLDDAFRRNLARRTRGHPLFTVETLDDMRERGDLQLDKAGRWTAGPAIQWDNLAARVEGVIEKRVQRLEPNLSELLSIASVEGEVFTAEVVALAGGLETPEAVRLLSRELDKKHRLVTAQGTQRVGGERISRYRFRHQLIQEHLYQKLDDVERPLLHEAVAGAIEVIFQGQTPESVAQLAKHYLDAELPEKALPCLIQAGDHARGLYGHDEAIQKYETALAILKESGKYALAARILLKLGQTYHNAFDYERAQRAYEESFALRRVTTAYIGDDAPPRAPHALRLVKDRETHLDPAKLEGWEWGIMTQLSNGLFSGLLALTPDLDVIPDVAESWEILDGGRKYLFHLRDDVRWSDGQPVTAADFAFAWRRALDPAVGKFANILFDVAGAAAFNRGESDALGVNSVDDRKLRVELTQPTGYFLQLLTNELAFPVPRHIVASHGEDWAEPGNFVGNGPFKIVEWQQDKSLVLERNPYYHGRFNGNVERVEYFLSDDPELPLARYEAGELDSLNLTSLATARWADAVRKHASDYVTWPVLSTIYIAFDTNRPPFDDRRVRQALALGVDKQRLASVHWQVTPATGGLVPPGMPGHVPGLAPPHDLPAARRLMAEAGYPGGRDFPRVKGLIAVPRRGLIESVLDAWEREMGIEIEREFRPNWQGAGGRAAHLLCYGWAADYPDPDNFLRVCLHSHHLENMKWLRQDAKYDDLIFRARQLMDHGQRLALYRQAEELLAFESPVIPIVYGRGHELVRPWTKNCRRQRNLHFKDIIIEHHS